MDRRSLVLGLLALAVAQRAARAEGTGRSARRGAATPAWGETPSPFAHADGESAHRPHDDHGAALRPHGGPAERPPRGGVVVRRREREHWEERAHEPHDRARRRSSGRAQRGNRWSDADSRRDRHAGSRHRNAYD